MVKEAARTGKTKSEDVVPQADKQAHTNIAQREGEEGAQAREINRERSEEGKKPEEHQKD